MGKTNGPGEGCGSFVLRISRLLVRLPDISQKFSVIPRQAPIKGKDNIRPLLTAFVREFSQSGSRFTSGQFTADGPMAFFLWNGDTPSNKYSFGADTFLVRDGRIAYVTVAFVGEAKAAKQ